MPTVRVDCDSMVDAASYHAAWAMALGFPGFYGRNPNAWVDCLSYLYEDVGMTSVVLAAEERLVLELSGIEALQNRLPDLVNELMVCVATVNQRHADRSEPAPIHLVLL